MIATITSKTLYSVEISIGSSFTAGLPLMYGEDFDAYKNYYEKNYEDTLFGGYTFSIPQIDLMFEFSPFFAVEIGLGYKLSTYSIEYQIHDDGDDSISGYSCSYTLSFRKNYVYLPLMLRGQYEYNLGISYFSAGFKFGFAVGSSYLTTFAQYTEGDFEGYFFYSGDVRPSIFLLDLSLSIGHEFRVGSSNYIGIRINYDFGIINPFYAIEGSRVEYYGEAYPFADNAQWHQDDITFAITYRYAF